MVNRKGSNLFRDNARHRVSRVSRKTLPKLNDLCYRILPHPAYSSDLSPTDSPFLKPFDNFIKGKMFKNQIDAENASNELTALKCSDSYHKDVRGFLKR
ncbi:hypothetical protein ANCCAN_01927 [Ancylostoma caninum]|uniref:Tc1-like transposase DDE domain-containing protein n=1 Tax=Ancylostoma caninum TaxID=29170 RepID=A0A368H898_ANCCA|nr:hypothetical protein ANCCAN_01927 [Ancylostoma caninum]